MRKRARRGFLRLPRPAPWYRRHIRGGPRRWGKGRGAFEAAPCRKPGLPSGPPDTACEGANNPPERECRAHLSMALHRIKMLGAKKRRGRGAPIQCDPRQ
jgi:hypothetical protein